MFAWSRTWYAKHNEVYYNFEAKRDRDDACKNYGFEKVSANEAYKHYPLIRVEWRNYKKFIDSIS